MEPAGDGETRATSDGTTARPKGRLAGLAVLAVALVAAGAVAAFLFLSDNDNAAASPEDVTRQLYSAVVRGDDAAFTALLEPGLRDDPSRALIPFGASAGSIEVGPATRVTVSDLAVRKINEEAGWASIGARGSASINGERTTIQQTIYLRQLNGAWFVSNEAEFLRSFASPEAKPSGNADLGPLEPNRPKVGELAPDFALLDARDQATVRKLSDFRGQAVILNWYASWCGPCKTEIPEFQAALDAVGPGLQVLGVDYLESAERATGILEIFKTDYPAVLDSDGRVADHYRVGPGIPVTFFIDKDGVLRAMKFGQIQRDELPALLAKVGITYTPPE